LEIRLKKVKLADLNFTILDSGLFSTRFNMNWIAQTKTIITIFTTPMRPLFRWLRKLRHNGEFESGDAAFLMRFVMG